MTTNLFAGRNRMNTKDLTVGQQLVRVVTTGGNWGSEIRRREELVTITKILKTRLVVETKSGTEYRVLVDFSKNYPWSNGNVQADIEGTDKNTWSTRNSFALYTLDDEELAKARIAIPARNEAIQRKRAAESHARQASDHLSAESAQTAIEALQAYLAGLDA